MTDKDTAGLHPAALLAMDEAGRIIRALAALAPPEIGMAERIADLFRHFEGAEPGTADFEAERIGEEGANMNAQTLCGHCFVLATAYAAQATAAALLDNGIEAWRQVSDANHWHGAARGLLFAGVEINRALLDAQAAAYKANAHAGAKAKLARDPKQAAKTQAHALFLAWMDGTGEAFDSHADFGRKMVERLTKREKGKDVPVLIDCAKVADWCTGWRREWERQRRGTLTP